MNDAPDVQISTNAPEGERDSGSLFYRLLRKDIGRKFTALLAALIIWTFLATLTRSEREIELEVIVVHTRAEANAERHTAPGLYLIVPEGYIVRSKSPERVTVKVGGLKDVVDVLEPSAVFTVDLEESGVEDEGQVDIAVAANPSAYSSRNSKIDVSEFDVTPRKVTVSLARRAEAEFELGPHNVLTTGVPREGYTFDESRIRVRPNRVRISGPSTVVEALKARPASLKLRPVNIEGAAFEVDEEVGIDPERVDRNLTLLTAGGVVSVTVPLQSKPYEHQLFAIPVHYLNEGALANDRRRVVSATEAVDILLTGPRAAIEALGNEQLVRRIRLQYDWADAQLEQAQARVMVYKSDLPDGVSVTNLDGGDVMIEYRIEDVPDDMSRTTENEGDDR